MKKLIKLSVFVLITNFLLSYLLCIVLEWNNISSNIKAFSIFCSLVSVTASIMLAISMFNQTLDTLLIGWRFDLIGISVAFAVFSFLLIYAPQNI